MDKFLLITCLHQIVLSLGFQSLSVSLLFTCFNSPHKSVFLLAKIIYFFFAIPLFALVNLCHKFFAVHGENMLCTCSPKVWAWNFHVLNLKFNDQSVVILWVSWCRNKSFWQRFTRISLLLFFFYFTKSLLHKYTLHSRACGCLLFMWKFHATHASNRRTQRWSIAGPGGWGAGSGGLWSFLFGV